MSEYNVAEEIRKEVAREGTPHDFARIIEEIGTPSAIEVARHIREDLERA